MSIDLDIERKNRRQKIMAVYGAILLAIFVLVVLWLTPNASCTNGKKDGLETGVDCGGICGACSAKVSVRDVLVQKTAFVSSGQGKYDLVVWLENPNEGYGARTIKGSFVLFGAERKVLREVPITSFLLPKGQKYVISQGVPVADPIESIEWKMTGVDWVDMNPVTDLRLSITDRKYEELSSGTGFGKVSGLLRNDSLYDWNDVAVSVLLFDSSGNVLATHGTSRQTFRSGEKWDFQLIFPDRFSGEVYTMDMQVETNVYDNNNFLKSVLPGGSFQSRGEVMKE